MLNEEDLLLLEKLRFDRFRHQFPSLIGAALCITLDQRLVIPCLTETAVQALLAEAEALQYFSWLILGVDRVSIYLEQQLVWEWARELQVALVDSPLRLESNDAREEAMSTATLERTTEAHQLEVEIPSQPLRTVDELAAELAAITGRDLDQIKLDILSLNPATYQFREYQLISPAVADQTIDRWSQAIKARLRSMPPTVEARSNGAAPVTPQPAVTAKSDRSKPAAKKTTKTAAKKPATPKPVTESAE